MKARPRTVIWLAIVCGGAGGALAAVAGDRPTPAGAGPAPSLRPVAEIGRPRPAPPPPPAIDGAFSAPSARPPSAATAAVITTVSNDSPLPAAAEAVAPAPMPETGKPAAPLTEIPVARLPPPPASAAELERAEIACYEKDPDQCQLAAIAHETGSAGAVNARQGERFRKIALTFYVAECERGLPHACFVLAAMHRSGERVQQSERKAEALLARARDLCRIRSAEECATLAPP